MHLHTSVTAVAMAGALCVALAGCSMGGFQSGGTSALTASPRPSSNQPSPAAAPTAEATAAAVNPTCPTAAQLMSTLQLSGLTPGPVDTESGESICSYLAGSGSGSPQAVVTFSPNPGLTIARVLTSAQKDHPDAQPVAGLADGALTWSGDNGGIGLSFITASTIVTIYTTVPTTLAGETALAQLILKG